MLAVVSEGLIYRPSSFGPALTGSARTGAARERELVAPPRCSAERGLQTQKKPTTPKFETIGPKLCELAVLLPLLVPVPFLRFGH